MPQAAIPALITAGASVYGAHKSSKAQKKLLSKQDDLFQSVVDVFGGDAMGSILGPGGMLPKGFDKQKAYAEQALYDPEYGLESVFGDIDQMGVTAKQGVLDQQKQAKSQQLQQSVSSGLFTSSQMENAYRGIDAATNKALLGIEEGLLGMKTAQKGKMAAGIAGLGDMEAQQALAMSNFAAQLGSILGGVKIQGGGAIDMGGIAEGLGGLFTALMADTGTGTSTAHGTGTNVFTGSNVPGGLAGHDAYGGWAPDPGAGAG